MLAWITEVHTVMPACRGMVATVTLLNDLTESSCKKSAVEVIGCIEGIHVAFGIRAHCVVLCGAKKRLSKNGHFEGSYDHLPIVRRTF